MHQWQSITRSDLHDPTLISFTTLRLHKLYSLTILISSKHKASYVNKYQFHTIVQDKWTHTGVNNFPKKWFQLKCLQKDKNQKTPSITKSNKKKNARTSTDHQFLLIVLENHMFVNFQAASCCSPSVSLHARCFAWNFLFHQIWYILI
jgi:hypothetical protein